MDYFCNVVINGRPVKVLKGSLPFERIAVLAAGRLEGATRRGPVLTVTYHGVGSDERTGSLLPGQTVRAAEGLVITAVVTGDA